MALEFGLVFDRDGKTIAWFGGKSGGSIPDTRDLWEVLWENRDRLGGVAHTHPWHGEAWPSTTDVTTFRAVELGLGRELIWPVVTFSEVGYFAQIPDEPGLYAQFDPKSIADIPPLALLDKNLEIEKLRELSR